VDALLERIAAETSRDFHNTAFDRPALFH
jgi:hypothetical protein